MKGNIKIQRDGKIQSNKETEREGQSIDKERAREREERESKTERQST